MADLKKEFDFFISHQDELVKRYNGKFIVIVGQAVVGEYDSIGDAYESSTKKFTPGTFLIQQCLPGKNAYTQTFNSRVIFSE